MPENRHGMPAMFRARRIGSAWPFARTRIAWSRGSAPAAIRRPISAAIQSASSEPDANTSSRTGGGRSHRPFGSQPLADARPDLEAIGVVEPDQAICRVEDRRERSVVPSQDDGPRPRVPLPEGEDVVHRRATEGVDRLVVVADHGHVAMGVAQQGDELRLGPVRVLELVDQDVPEPAGDRRPGGRRAAHRRRASATWSPKSMQPLAAMSDWYVAYARGELRLAPRVLGGARLATASGSAHGPASTPDVAASATSAASRGHPLRMGLVVRRRDVLVLAAAEQGGQRRQEPGGIAERPVGVELELEEVLAKEDHDLRTGQHPDVRGQPELQGVVADQAVAERVERGDRGVRVAIRARAGRPGRPSPPRPCP